MAGPPFPRQKVAIVVKRAKKHISAPTTPFQDLNSAFDSCCFGLQGGVKRVGWGAAGGQQELLGTHFAEIDGCGCCREDLRQLTPAAICCPQFGTELQANTIL
eukprot:1159095-Pelagomonas_calceolata.AAC.5